MQNEEKKSIRFVTVRKIWSSRASQPKSDFFAQKNIIILDCSLCEHIAIVSEW